MLNTKRLFFSAIFLLSLALVLGGFVGCGSSNPAASDNTLLAPNVGANGDSDGDNVNHEFEGEETGENGDGIELINEADEPEVENPEDEPGGLESDHDFDGEEEGEH